MKIKFIVLIIFLFSASSFGGLFEKFPQHSERVLSNGRLITLPVHYYISKGMIVKGDGNFEELNSVLSAQSLKFRWTSRFRRNGETRYKMFYYFVEHVDNSIAPYGEFFVLIPAKSEDGKKKGFLVEQMIVSQRDALLAGREIWGINKSKADFKFSWNDRFGGKIELVGEDCEMQLNASENYRLKFGMPPLFPIPVNLNIRLVANKELSMPLWSNSLLRGRPRISLWKDSADKIVVTKGRCAEFFERVAFRPKSITYYPEAQAVLFEPLN